MNAQNKAPTPDQIATAVTDAVLDDSADPAGLTVAMLRDVPRTQQASTSAATIAVLAIRHAALIRQLEALVRDMPQRDQR